MRLLVTAGPTREAIDPVRFISNRSTGKMGYAVARAGLRLGHAVRLVSGPVALEPPAGAACVAAGSAAEMLARVQEHLPWCDALVMAAAVADWTPAEPSATKLKKAAMPATLRLRRTPDILAACAPLKGARVFVGFAAETEDLERNARAKREAKGLDLVVANDVTQPDAGFEAETNRVLFVSAAGVEALPLLSKDALGERIVAWIVSRRTGSTH
jgi:phosphopantothenoylcysteine decarboxylase / phosphopantothenate---cysteine ligase